MNGLLRSVGILSCLLLCSPLMIGCNSAQAGPAYDFSSVIASEVALAAQVVSTPDAPKPGDTCPNCNGVGKVGDGTVMVTCQECEGSGKVTQAKAPQQAPVINTSTPVVCLDGTCGIQPAMQRQAAIQTTSYPPSQPASYPVIYQAPHLVETVSVSSPYTTAHRGLFGRRVQYCGPGGCR